MSKVTAPFKGRPATDLLKYFDSLLATSSHNLCVDRYREITDYLLEIDADCSLSIEIEAPAENPTGLTPVAMVEKMDILLKRLLDQLANGVSEDFYIGALSVFEQSVLKLHRPNYVQFVTFCLAISSKERADNYLNFLLNVIHDDGSDPIGRREAIAYVGSFVCRSKLLGWTHSARTGKYLLSFMTNLTLDRRLLLVLALQTVCYMFCWECERWDPRSMELDWVYRSNNGLLPLIRLYKNSSSERINLFRLVSFDLLTRLLPLIGRFSVELKKCVAEAIRDRKELIPSGWKFCMQEDPHFPFDTSVRNLVRSGVLIAPLIRDWVEPSLEIPDLVEEAIVEKNSANEADEEIWSYREIISSPISSPFFGIAEPDVNEKLCDNIVLSRILSSKSFVLNPEL